VPGREPDAVRAVVFDIGGVLEDAPDTAVARAWERRLGLAPAELGERLGHVWAAGEIGIISEAEEQRSVGRLLGLDAPQVTAFMQDIWAQYLGTLNAELAGYFGGLRPAT
jgi:hypothetical protein